MHVRTAKPLEATAFRLNIAASIGVALALAASAHADPAADAQQLQLLNRVLAGMKCRETSNNGRICDYTVGKLSLSIKDVGGIDTVVGLRHSDIEDELYAVLYFGCIAVVPGKAQPRNHNPDYGVHISPVTGNVYSTNGACRAANGQTAN
jgi:hypothetical protein